MPEDATRRHAHDPWRHEDDARRPGPPPHRPPWWPDDEPFPPRGREAWRVVRRHFLWRVAAAFGLFLLVVVAISALGATVLSRVLGDHPGAGRPLLPLIGLVVVLALLIRGVRRVAAPLADVMTAADRLAGGDHSARVRPRGPREVRRLGVSFNAMAQRLEETEARRRDLLADIAHELRTPIAVVRANLEGLLDGVYEPDEARLRALLHQTESVSWLLDDLRTLSTAESGALLLHREWVDLGALVLEVADTFETHARASGVTLRTEVPPDLDDVEVDPVRIGQVLTNLVSNALRHTPAAGEVTVSLTSAEDGVEVTVADTGEGIAPDELPRVFDRYVRASDSGGSGLGLAIAKRLVDAHGGTLSVDSRPGEGSTFRITLPV